MSDQALGAENCGCGNNVRYETPNGMSCNRHLRCADSLDYENQSNPERAALSDIRVAIGDPEGKLEVAEVVERVRAMAEELEAWRDDRARIVDQNPLRVLLLPKLTEKDFANPSQEFIDEVLNGETFPNINWSDIE